MLWPALTIISLLALAILQVWWRVKLRQAKVDAQLALDKLQKTQAQASQQIQTQQEALFDSMAEGLLLLDDGSRVQLANRAFHQLFGVTSDIRSRTIMEALRLHELTELVEVLGSQ